MAYFQISTKSLKRAFDNKKYFLEGLPENGIFKLFLYEMVEGGKEYTWNGDADNYPVNSFLEAPVFNGKTFYEVEKDIKWVDC